MRRVERQFLSMAFLILFVVGLVLALDAVAMNRARAFIHQAIDYFDCLQVRFQEDATRARRRTRAILPRFFNLSRLVAHNAADSFPVVSQSSININVRSAGECE